MRELECLGVQLIVNVSPVYQHYKALDSFCEMVRGTVHLHCLLVYVNRQVLGDAGGKNT